MGAGHSVEGDGATSDPPTHSRRKNHNRRRRHSVDSVASYSSQNHVDRIRTQNFSAASCQDECDFGSIKTSLFRRSSSNVDIQIKRPESVASNTSSTRSRLRDFVERKSSQDEHRPAANTVADIQYFENPTETLEFDNPRNSLESKKSQEENTKKRKLPKTKDKECENKNKKQEKYQSKLAEYYKLPLQLPQDEFYQHLTRSKAAEEFLQKRFSNSDTEYTASYGRLCKHKDIEGSNLRRSRSLAVIREETFTDLQIQNHPKTKRSQLIPRARLFDKPCFRDRLIGRAKYQTKEEVLEGIYIDSTVSCFGDINRQRVDEEPNPPGKVENKSEKEDPVSRSGSHHSKSIGGSWPNLHDEIKQTNGSEESICHSRNPSEIDSLDSNYVRKHYNFEAHLKNYKGSSPETERSVASLNNSKDLYISTDDPDSDNEGNKSKTQSSTDNDCNIVRKTDTLEEFALISSEIDETETRDNVFVKIKQNCNLEKETNLEEQNEVDKKGSDSQSTLSENDERISSPADSITSYISISIASSIDKSHKLEYLANSLAEKIDEYCDSQNVSVNSNTNNSETHTLDTDPIYTKVNKQTTFSDIKKHSYTSEPCESKKVKIKTPTNEIYVTNTFIKCNNYSEDSYCTSTKNITTEPFVTTLIENQYYSLPDINISKCLRKSERIDAQLREEDPEDILCENTYEVAHSHFKEILPYSNGENYGQLNKVSPQIYHKSQINVVDNSSYFREESNPHLLQNFTKLEDDLKSIITIDSSYADDSSYYQLDHHQNEREINEIEGTIRNNKVITKSESLKLASNVSDKPDIKLLKSLSNDNINTSLQRKRSKRGIRKHYSLRQRNPTDNDNIRIPSPNSVEKTFCRPIQSQISNLSFSDQIKNHSLLTRVQSFKTSAESNVSIIPLSGHQTIVIDPPIKQSTQEQNNNIVKNIKSEINDKIHLKKNTQDLKCEKKLTTRIEDTDLENTKLTNNILKDTFITIKLNKVVKKTIPKLNTSLYESAGDNYYQRPPPKLVINDSNNNFTDTNLSITMTRPQVLQVIDSKNKKQNGISGDKTKNGISGAKMNNLESKTDCKESKIENNNVKERLNNAIKTDIEYQEKINSVKNYWSKLIEKSPENQNKEDDKDKTEESVDNIKEEKANCEENDNNNNKCVPEVSVGSIIKTLENVKIVDSIKKISQTKLKLWKEETEKVKSDSEIEEPTVEKIVKDTDKTIYDHPKIEKSTKKPELDICRDTPDIEIVELSSDNQNEKTQATLIKAKGYEKGCDEFDHVRYKVMKSELFKNSMIANYRKEAQFDGLLQYLQDYSFQELLVNNNIVIIEPVRTKVEPAPRKNTTDTCKIPPTLLKKPDCTSHVDKSKNAIRRHFFYHPIRINKEIIEEELPNPDTVKKVRNLFEDTLKMKSPMTHDPPLIEETSGLTRRATSYRNLSEEIKESKVVGRKKITRQLTIDTNVGNKKWDNASLSSGVSSGDLSSNNEYETDGLSPYSQKTIKDNVYSSSDEYLCDSASQDFCCESQYVSPDILKKIRDCGTSVTYYGGKVLNSKPGSTVSPMTKAIMEEIKGLQKNCSRDCYSCQTKCKGDKCSCVTADKHRQITAKQIAEREASQQGKNKQMEFPGFKFKLVKSNSCSSRLELTGTDEGRNPRLKFRKQNIKEDPPLLVHDEENSVKNKICRLESYSKGVAKTPFQNKDNDTIPRKINGKEIKEAKSLAIESSDPIQAANEQVTINKCPEATDDIRYSIQNDKQQANDPHSFEKKYYYVNDNVEQRNVPMEKFGEMVFEEFEVLENCYDSLNSNKSPK